MDSWLPGGLWVQVWVGPQQWLDITAQVRAVAQTGRQWAVEYRPAPDLLLGPYTPVQIRQRGRYLAYGFVTQSTPLAHAALQRLTFLDELTHV